MDHNITRNQYGVIENRWQDYNTYKRVVTLCSAGCLRSPTAAVVLSQAPFNYNTRAAGLTMEYALIPFTPQLAAWADEIVVMEPHQADLVRAYIKEWFGEDRYYFNESDQRIICLNIPDNFAYRDEDLVRMIKERYLEETNDGE